MKTRLIIITEDRGYAEHLAKVLSKNYSEYFEVSTCTNLSYVSDMLGSKKYDIVLVEPDLLQLVKSYGQKLTVIMWNIGAEISQDDEEIAKILKFRRISNIVSQILSLYAEIAETAADYTEQNGRIIAVWSPSGGVGKTTVAMAYAAREAARGADATYLSLEHFSGTSVYFGGEGKSISSLFERLNTNNDLAVVSTRHQDSITGVYYFTSPDNYDDINELSVDDIKQLVDISIQVNGITVIDLPSICDSRIREVMMRADKVLLVTDGSKTAEAKLSLFLTQNSVFNDICDKISLVSNKNSYVQNPLVNTVVCLPEIPAADPIQVYKSLSCYSFDPVTV